jgi:hypothetical protein
MWLDFKRIRAKQQIDKLDKNGDIPAVATNE